MKKYSKLTEDEKKQLIKKLWSDESISDEDTQSGYSTERERLIMNIEHDTACCGCYSYYGCKCV